MIINGYATENEQEISIPNNSAGEQTYYLYVNPEDDEFFYSDSIFELFDYPAVGRMHDIAPFGMSLALQSGVIPPPFSIFKNIYLLGIGTCAIISKNNERKTIVKFSNNYPFKFNKKHIGKNIPNKDKLFDLIVNATNKRLDFNTQNYLFHSAGKDSNLLALAYAKAGWQEKLVFVSHKSDGNTDESQISKKIAEKLGFKHITVDSPQHFNDELIFETRNYFNNSPFPLLDNVTLAFPFYSLNFQELKNSNIIIGDGIDAYIGSPPSKRDSLGMMLNSLVPSLNKLRRHITSESPLNQIFRTPVEWVRMSGFSDKDSNFYSDFQSTYDFWQKESTLRRHDSFLDLKTEIYAAKVIYEVYIRKFKQFCNFQESNLVMPFMDNALTEYIFSWKEEYLFDRKYQKNKVYFRELLKDEIGLDSDIIGKKGYSLNTAFIIRQNLEWILEEINQCKLWQINQIKEVCNRLLSSAQHDSWKAGASYRLIYRLFLISIWHNHSAYVLRDI